MKIMKKLSTAFLAVSLMVFVSCENDKNNDVNNVGSGSITAKIDGTQIEFGNVSGAKALGLLTLKGDKGDVRIVMLFKDDIKEGTYSGDDLPNMTYTPDKGVTGLLAMSGSVTITKHNETSNVVEGTFDVVFSNYGYEGGDVVAKGSFKVEYADAGI